MRSIELGRDVLHCGAADGAGIDAHAIHQHGGVVAVGAADEYRGDLAGPAIAADVDAGVKLQQARDIGRERALELLARNDDDGREHLVEQRSRYGLR